MSEMIAEIRADAVNRVEEKRRALGPAFSNEFGGCGQAMVASSFLPPSMAVRTFLIEVRRRERAAMLWARRLTSCFARFSADLMFATDFQLLGRRAVSARLG